MLLLSLLTLKTHGCCCSMQCEMKFMNVLSRSESAVKARRLISSCQTLMETVSKVGYKFSHVIPSCMRWQNTKVHHLRRILPWNFYNIGRHVVVQFVCYAGQGYITVCCYKIHNIRTKINQKLLFTKKINLELFGLWNNTNYNL